MNNVNQHSQLGFTFSTVTPESKPPFLLSAMAHLADRLHTKIDMMRKCGMMENLLSLTIKQDDVDMIETAIRADVSRLSATQIATFTDVAHIVLTSKNKAYFTYDEVESLFNALTH